MSMSRSVPVDLIKTDGTLNTELFNKAKEYCNALSFVRSPITKIYTKYVLLLLSLVKQRLASDATLPPEEIVRINEMFRKALGNIKVEVVNNHGDVGFKAIETKVEEKANTANVKRAVAAMQAQVEEAQKLLGLEMATKSLAAHSKSKIKTQVQAGTALTPEELKAKQAAMNVYRSVAQELGAGKTERRSSSGEVGDLAAEINETANEMTKNAAAIAEEHNASAGQDKISMSKLMSSSLFSLAASTLAGTFARNVAGGFKTAKSVLRGESAQYRQDQAALDAVKEMIASNKDVASQRHNQKLAEITDEQRELGYHVGVRSAGLSWENFEDLVVKQRRDGPKVVAAFMAEAKAQGGVVKDMDAALEKVKKAAPASPPPRPGRKRGDSDLL